MMFRILKVLILLAITKEIATFGVKIKQEKSENKIVKFLLDPNFTVNNIAIWANVTSDLQNDILKAVIERGFPLTLFTKNHTMALTSIRFNMIIIFMNGENVVSVKVFYIII